MLGMLIFRDGGSIFDWDVLNQSRRGNLVQVHHEIEIWLKLNLIGLFY
jgi:hypothetical protein